MHIRECEVGMEIKSVHRQAAKDQTYSITSVNRNTEEIKIALVDIHHTYAKTEIFGWHRAADFVSLQDLFWGKPEVKSVAVNKCTCDIHALMRSGCKCGGV